MNTFLSLIKRELSGPEVEISLKSCVPIFIAFPELLTPANKTISAVAPYYRSGVDYENRNNTVDVGVSERPLLTMFNAILSTILNKNLAESTDKELPRLFLNVDIGYDCTIYGTIAPNTELASPASGRVFFEGLSLTANLAAAKRERLTDNQKHNFLLLQSLRKRCNDSGIWR